MKGILIVNMGSPSSEREMKVFLKNMFKDPAILPFSSPMRCIAAHMISTFRFKKSWKKYKLIGGSPLKDSCNAIRKDLEEALEKKVPVSAAFSYSSPYIEEAVNDLKSRSVTDIIVIPLYPHKSFSTTGSIEKILEKISRKQKDLKIRLCDEYYDREQFIGYWKSLVLRTMQNRELGSPLLLFSAHSIPMSHLEAGDTYVKSIEKSAALIAETTGLKHVVSYQSKMGRIKWAGPDTKTLLAKLAEDGVNEIIIVPVSFLNENLETLYDLDQDIIPFGINKLNIRELHRVQIPMSHPMLISALAEIAND